MAKKGSHQKPHTRTSKNGKVFSAGKGTVKKSKKYNDTHNELKKLLEHNKKEIDGKFRVNERGNLYIFGFFPADLYELCPYEKGWRQVETKQDSDNFGIRIHKGMKQIMHQVEGSLTLIVCSSEYSFHKELKYMSDFYGMDSIHA